MFIVTGGAGFIGSAFVWKLNTMGITDIVVVDHLDESEKWKNLVNLRFTDYLDRDDFLTMVVENGDSLEPEAIIHMGACSSTTQRDSGFLMENNYRYSQILATFAADKGVRFINASSAATYGDGSSGFSDSHKAARHLRPLNMYGYSKQLFDLWAMDTGVMDRVASLKFFNVFGPNEFHKGDMMSVVCKAHAQIRESGRVSLFKSHRDDYPDGGQMRDFVYVKDCVDFMWWLLENPEVNGIYNVGTGKARTFADLARATFAAMGKEPAIDFVEMPEAIRGKYQYFTEAPMDKVRKAGYRRPFTSLEEAVADYVVNFLEKDDPYLGNEK